ncbi:ATP-binding protein [Umezawaea beigongshangensis]|uniref:ATP-binding protein n=1 Tax=Umezawaea beigongshangensis TaxID=2780383 RepID=UPI0018F2335E|nr:ATP-binding protein [Umezawaea beigongshangensis]
MDTAETEQNQHDFDIGSPEDPRLSELRAWVRDLLADLHSDVVADAELVVTELAANACEHAEGPRSLRLIRRSDEPVVDVEVDDASPDALPRPGLSTLGDFRGRGLLMVETMSTSWGVRQHPGRKTVWARLPAVP